MLISSDSFGVTKKSGSQWSSSFFSTGSQEFNNGSFEVLKIYVWNHRFLLSVYSTSQIKTQGQLRLSRKGSRLFLLRLKWHRAADMGRTGSHVCRSYYNSSHPVHKCYWVVVGEFYIQTEWEKWIEPKLGVCGESPTGNSKEQDCWGQPWNSSRART